MDWLNTRSAIKSSQSPAIGIKAKSFFRGAFVAVVSIGAIGLLSYLKEVFVGNEYRHSKASSGLRAASPGLSEDHWEALSDRRINPRSLSATLAGGSGGSSPVSVLLGDGGSPGMNGCKLQGICVQDGQFEMTTSCGHFSGSTDGTLKAQIVTGEKHSSTFDLMAAVFAWQDDRQPDRANNEKNDPQCSVCINDAGDLQVALMSLGFGATFIPGRSHVLVKVDDGILEHRWNLNGRS